MGLNDVGFVEALPGDEATLWRMLTYAASMEDGGDAMVAIAKADEFLRGYVEGWGSKPGDLGIIARRDGGAAVGAAWLRLRGTSGHFTIGDGRDPELATAVLPEMRGRGIGTAMMVRLMEAARPVFSAVVLSVREDNPAVRFYVSLGFRETARMQNRVGGTSLVMTCELTPRSEP
ncbi:hypothetical protein YTPLAS18_36430 [Nitrospira sp.]|nr:hypothetical protein YTPLAS18_36430 [Nitrospira sp.]